MGAVLDTTFRERLRDAMLVAGVESVTSLAERAQLPEMVIRQALETHGESLMLREGLMLCRALRLRVGWLLDGEPPITPTASTLPGEPALLLAWAALSGEKRESLLRIALRMSGDLGP